jgi:hypothetical protein
VSFGHQLTALSVTTLIGLASLGCGHKSGTTPPENNGPACTDALLGVCRIADAGIRHITLSRAGANGLAVDSTTGRVYVVINGAPRQSRCSVSKK